VVSVTLDCGGGNRCECSDLKDKLFDGAAVRIVDANGTRSRLLGVNWDESYQTLTFRFFAHEDSDLKLLVENVAKQAGQPGRFELPLR
jgi:hypothetical protein